MLPENIILTEEPGKELSKFLTSGKYSKMLVLVDENTYSKCYPLIESAFNTHHVITVSSGEEHKSLQTCMTIWQAMTDAQLDRHSVLIILGGGVLGDMGGFCAATYKRGIDFILIPTTLLAQADASIGGKLGIDFNHFKNHIGLFKQPALTILHTGFLKTLSQYELRSGFAEVIKHALISDKNLWDSICTKELANQDWNSLLKQSAEFKYSVIAQDPYEEGLRKILNTGHTIGHALETYFLVNENKISHGEAIAAGLIAECWIAVKKNLLDQKSLNQITDYILKVFGKLNLSESSLQKIATLCIQDKKNKGNSVLAAFLNGVGKAKWDVEISLEEIVESLQFYRSYQT